MKDHIDIKITKTITAHYSKQELWYILPTVACVRRDWEKILHKKRVSYLLCLMWLRFSVGFTLFYTPKHIIRRSN